jgi:hypothetical protein
MSIKENDMLKKLLVLLLTSVLTFPLATAVFAQDAPAKEKVAKESRWDSQEHGSKKVNNIDASEVKDGDRVICKGTFDKDGVLHATLISKRLTGM